MVIGVYLSIFPSISVYFPVIVTIEFKLTVFGLFNVIFVDFLFTETVVSSETPKL